MERQVQVHFERPESFYGKIDLPETWESMELDEQMEWLDLYFQHNPGIRSVIVEEFDADF